MEGFEERERKNHFLHLFFYETKVMQPNGKYELPRLGQGGTFKTSFLLEWVHNPASQGTASIKLKRGVLEVNEKEKP